MHIYIGLNSILPLCTVYTMQDNQLTYFVFIYYTEASTEYVLQRLT